MPVVIIIPSGKPMPLSLSSSQQMRRNRSDGRRTVNRAANKCEGSRCLCSLQSSCSDVQRFQAKFTQQLLVIWTAADGLVLLSSPNRGQLGSETIQRLLQTLWPKMRSGLELYLSNCPLDTPQNLLNLTTLHFEEVFVEKRR